MQDKPTCEQPGDIWIVRLAPQRTWLNFAKYHYLPHLPGPNKATYTLHLRIRLAPCDWGVGIICYTYPPVSSAARNTVFGPVFKPSFSDRKTAAALAHRCITTLSRMVIIPPFQPMKLATPFLKATAATFDTPILEAYTIIGRSLRFFGKAGMTVLEPEMSVQARRARRALHHFNIDTLDATSAPHLKDHLGALNEEDRAFLVRRLSTWHTYHCRGLTTGTHKKTLDAVLEDVAMNLFQTTYYAYKATPYWFTTALRTLMAINGPLVKDVEPCQPAESKTLCETG